MERTLVLFLLAVALPSFAAVPAAGQKAPTFTLTNYNGVPFALEKFRGSWVVLYFCADNFSAPCTLEARRFQRDLARYGGHKAVIVGVSVASEDTQRQFRSIYELGFSLLADSAGEVSNAYGSVTEDNGRRSSKQNTFLIDPDGKIARVFETVNPRTHSDEVLAVLQTLSPAPSPKRAEGVLTNDDVIALVATDLGDEIVIAKIKTAAQVKFDTSTDALVALKGKKVSNPVLAAMIERSAATTRTKATLKGTASPT